ncbi:MAG: hypothetical protein QOG82_237 [Actinomycetota bacterium]|jgi:hypothetical protein|nr:hypothetical protein [Actinomycetota bacterium]
MTRRQAAPPAQRWLLVIVALLAGPWLGQGAAFAYSVDLSTSSGRVGDSVTVTLTDFGAGCVVYFDDTAVAGDRGCEERTELVFDVPESSVGRHEIRAYEVGVDGMELIQTMPFDVRATPATAPPISSPPVSVAAADINVGEVGEVGAPTTVARPVTTAAGGATPSPTTTTAAGQPTTTSTAGQLTAANAAPVGFAAGCKPGEVALMRFAVAPTHGRPGDAVSGSTSWGSVGTCSEKRALRVILDGKTVPGAPPDAGTSGKFEMTIPRDADAGRHTLALVADDDPSVELATIAFQVEKAKASIPLVALAAGGATVLLVLLLIVMRRRRRKARRADDAWASDDGGGGWGGVLDVPDIAGESEPEPDLATPTAVIVVEDHPTMPVVPLVVASGRHGSYYLLERQNPHAPRRANGKRGWYRDQRTQPIRGLAVALVEAHTAGAAASELATGERAVSAHVVVDTDGALDLLPDDVVAVHRPEHDDATLVMLLAGVGNDPVADEVVLAHAARWAAAKMREHAIPARLVTATEFAAGEPGLVADEHALLWQRIVSLARVEPADGGAAVDGTPASVGPAPPAPSAPAPPAAQPAPTAFGGPIPSAPPASVGLAASGTRAPIEAAAGFAAPAPSETAVPVGPGASATQAPIETPAAFGAPAASDTSAPVGPAASATQAPIEAPVPPAFGAPAAPETQAPVEAQPPSGPLAPSLAAAFDALAPAVPRAFDPPTRFGGGPAASETSARDAGPAPSETPAAFEGQAPAPPAGFEGPARDASSPVGTAPVGATTPIEAPTPTPAPVQGVGPFEAAGSFAPGTLGAVEAAAESVVDRAVDAVSHVGADTGRMAEAGPPSVAATTPAPPTLPPSLGGPPSPPPPPRGRRALPTPDELIAEVMAEPTYFLVEHENPHATLRANGKHGWYYPTRYGGVRAVVLHTIPGDTADAIAAHLASVDQPEAAHAVIDPDVIVELLPDDATALHGVRSSSAAIDLALAYPSAWGTDRAREEAVLVRAATWAGVRAVRHGIPVRRITVDQWHSGQGGIVANADVDPGPDFPWDRFLQLTAWVAGRVASGAMSSR